MFNLMKIIALLLVCQSSYAWDTMYSGDGAAGSSASTWGSSETWDVGATHSNSGAWNNSWAGSTVNLHRNSGMVDTSASTRGGTWGTSGDMSHTSSMQDGFARSFGDFRFRGMR